MSATLIKFKSDWGDEFDCEQFVVFNGTVEEARARINEVFLGEDVPEDSEWYFGTNEYFTKEDLSIEKFTLVALTKEQADVMFALFPKQRFGTGIVDRMNEL